MRNNQAKPGIDWYEIESRVKGGESLLSISKDYDISREAIRKRSLKEGWLETNKNIRLARQVVAVATKEKSDLATSLEAARVRIAISPETLAARVS